MATVFTSDNLDEIHTFLSSAYTSVRLKACPGEQPYYRVARNPLGQNNLDHFQWGFETDYAVGPLGAVTVIGVESGAFPRHETDGVRDGYGPGEVFLLSQPDRPFAGRMFRPHYSLTMVAPALLSQVAQTDHTEEPVRLTGYRPVTPAAGRQLMHTIRFLRESVVAEPAVRDVPLVAAAASRYLAAMVLYAFPNSARTDPTIEDRHDAHPDTLRRAIAYIDDHAHEDISAADIAAAAHVTIRAVQHAFRRHRGITPMGYLRQARLQHAHQDLLAADPGTGVTVTDVAARWGFFHPGRFAHYYRNTYGCPPYQTLQRDNG